MAEPQAQLEESAVIPVELVRIRPYDPRWPLLFLAESAALQEAVGAWASGGIHHVGSTAISGVDAVPVIDIMVGCRDQAGAEACVPPLTELGYRPLPADRDGGPRLLRSAGDDGHFDLRLVAVNSPRYWEALAFRDHLRDDRQAALGYAGMKRDILSRHDGDGRLYAAAKSELIEIVLASL